MSKVTTNKEVATPKEESQFNFPTEVVELPSKGLVYSEDSPLAGGKITMKYYIMYLIKNPYSILPCLTRDQGKKTLKL